TLLPDQQNARNVAALLCLDATRHAHDNQPASALRSCLGVLSAARSIGDEPFAICQLIRIGCASYACRTLERVLAQTGPAPRDLRRVQEALLAEDRHHGLRIAARGERASMHELFDALERGDMTLSELAGGSPSWSWQERVYGFAMRDRVRSEHPLLL